MKDIDSEVVMVAVMGMMVAMVVVLVEEVAVVTIGIMVVVS